METAQEFVHDLLELASRDRLPELFQTPPREALYFSNDRHGISVVAVPTTGCSEEQLRKILRYRLAQYVAVGFIAAETVFAQRLEYEPLSSVSPSDIHCLALSRSGEILCYALVRSLGDCPEDATLRSRDRPLFPVEEAFGWGVFNRLQMLPDIPLQKIRELKRLVKNQRLSKLDEAGVRAPIEIVLAVIRMLTGALRMEVDAFVGDLEESVAKRQLDYFHCPVVVIHGAMPVGQYTGGHMQNSNCYPFAGMVSDLSDSVRRRLPQIEAALALPGRSCVQELMRLKHGNPPLKSSLQSSRGLDPLSHVVVTQKGVTMDSRQQRLNLGRKLREFHLFGGLSLAEASTLRSFMQTLELPAGQAIVRQGEDSDCLYLIEEGVAMVETATAAGDRVELARLGPGEYFGEIGLITGGERIADVIALTPIHLLTLDRETYHTYLHEHGDLEAQISLTAARRAAEALGKTRKKKS